METSDEGNSKIFSNYHALHRFVRSSITKQARGDSEDIVQETFAEACRNREQLLGMKTASEAGVWLRTVAKRKIIDRFRRAAAKKRQNGSNTATLEHQNALKMVRTPSSFAARREAGDLLSLAMSRLAERHARAIQLRYYKHLSFAEVAEEIGISEKAAQMLVKRALVCLRQELGGRKSKFF